MATIELNEFLLGMWSVEINLPLVQGNWIGALSKSPSGTYLMQFRFRWYRDDKIGPESKDKRSYYEAIIKVPSDLKAIQEARRMAGLIQENSGTNQTWELLKGERTPEQFLEILETMPGIHTQRVKADNTG